jgi:hypothetical protein
MRMKNSWTFNRSQDRWFVLVTVGVIHVLSANKETASCTSRLPSDLLVNCDVLVFETNADMCPTLHKTPPLKEFADFENDMYERKSCLCNRRPLYNQLMMAYERSEGDFKLNVGSLIEAKELLSIAVLLRPYKSPGVIDSDRMFKVNMFICDVRQYIANAKKRATKKRARKKKRAQQVLKCKQAEVSALVVQLSLQPNEEEEELCCVCLDELSTVTFTNCNHTVTCEKCAMSLTTCPVCRAKIA